MSHRPHGFNATHEITLTDKRDGARRKFHVSLCEDRPGSGGPAYKAHEWVTMDTADWEVRDGQWWFQGDNPSPAPYLTTSVRKLHEDR